MHKNMREFLEVNPERLGWQSTVRSCNHFVDSDLRLEIFFEKEGDAEKEGIDFETGDIGISANLYWGLKEIS